MEVKIPRWAAIVGGVALVVIAAGIVLAIALSGDSDQAPSSTADELASTTTVTTTSAAAAGTYSVIDPNSGATVTLELPDSSADPQLSEWQEHIAALGGDPSASLWGKVTLDNRNGYSPVSLDFPDAFTATTSDGTQLSFSVAQRWPGCVEHPNSCSSALYSQDVHIYNKYLDYGKAVQGAKTETLIYSSKNERPIHAPADVARVFLITALEPVEMTSGLTPPSPSAPPEGVTTIPYGD